MEEIISLYLKLFVSQEHSGEAQNHFEKRFTVLFLYNLKIVVLCTETLTFWEDCFLIVASQKYPEVIMNLPMNLLA
jgi:hypothetical protein